MATTKEFTSTQNTIYFNALVASSLHPPELALKIILSSLKAGMSEQQASNVEAQADEVTKDVN